MSKETPGKKTSRGFEGLAELKPVLEHRQMQQSSGDEQHPPKNAEAPKEERMTEEELLAGLRGEVPTPARQEAEVAMRQYFDRLQSGTETPAQIHDAVVADLSQEAYMEFRHILDVYERQEEIGAIEKKSPPAQKEKKPAKADDILDVISKDKKSSSPETGGRTQKALEKELSSMGTTAKEVRKHLGEPAGNIDGISYWLLPDGAAAMLSGGPPEHRKLQRWGAGGFQKVKGVYYEYKDGAFKKMTKEEGLARERAMREAPQKPKPRREKAKAPESAKKTESQPSPQAEAPAQAPDNSHKFKRAFDKLEKLRKMGAPRADQIAFASIGQGMSDAEFTEFEQLVKARDKERDDQKKAEKLAAKAAANTAQPESGTERQPEEQPEEHAERKETRSFKEMHRIFNKKKREGVKTGPAFKAAVEDQSLDRARKFKKELEDDGESHGLLEGAMRELEQKNKKEKTGNEQGRDKKIEEMVDTMFSAPTRSAAESMSQSEQDKDIDSLVDRIFASNASSR